ncbi:NUDIX domain-containing protein [Georgenia sp. 10Sc9-8]|uniref:NUDIX domain-containing protein n=1 Tax=Georgenia halotolerans TaxID=3028317 RepID=A0ABT5U0F8_9MICO|nr:NUDIX domain-containing protein [Georgenia halotolerans]
MTRVTGAVPRHPRLSDGDDPSGTMEAMTDPGEPPCAFRHLDEDAATLLTAYRPATAEQERQRRRVLDHLHRTPKASWRGSGPVHLTASLLVLAPDGAHVLLARHRKARLWLQLGGHLEATDTDVRAAAEREGCEESGLSGLRALPTLVDVDCHTLGPGFACREHLDLRFAATADPAAATTTSAESDDLGWFPATDLPAGTGGDVPRLVAAARAAVRAG